MTTYLKNQMIKRRKCLLLVFLLIIFGVQSSFGQRVFVVSESGYVQEAKEGEGKKSGAGVWTRLKNGRPISIKEPFAVFIQGVEDVNKDEWFLLMTNRSSVNKDPIFLVDGFTKKIFKKKSSITQISDNLFEIKFIDQDYLRKKSQAPDCDRYFSKGEFVLAYFPNKEHKKNGDKERYWYIAPSKYESYDGISYTHTQIENAINEIISTNTSTQQLFASIVPKSNPQYATANSNVQYVVVQPTQTPQTAQVVSEGSNERRVQDSDVDIDIPYSPSKSENAFALIIANENYNKVASVPFALRDGQRVKDYLIRTLGFNNDHVTFVENATLNDMRYELNRLSKISEAYDGNMSLVVYFCGHGIPDEKNGNGYLLPIDGYGTDVTTAFSTDELYKQLGRLNTKRTVLFLDACFSGASKEGGMLIAARGIAIKSQEAKPTGSLIVFSACQGDETAYPYNEKGHGLMTYYLLKKLQETKGDVTLGELEEYIQDNVSKTAIVTNGKPQTPSVSVSPDLQSTWKSNLIIEK